MNFVPLADLRGRFGLPSDKTTLIRKFRVIGIPERTAPTRGGHRIEFDIDGLPDEPRLVVLRALHGIEPEATDTTSFEEFANDPRAWCRQEAERRFEIVRFIEDAVAAGSSKGAAIREARAKFGISPATCKNYLHAVKGLERPAYFKALMPGYKPGKPKAEIHADAWRFFLGYKGRPENPSLHKCYLETRKSAAKNSWGDLPSQKTFERHWNAIPHGERVFMQNGSRGLRDTLPTHHRDRSGKSPLHGVNIDSRIWDVFVKMPDGRIIRPVIAWVQDEATGYALSWGFAETENTDLYRRIILHTLENHGWIEGQSYFRFDNTFAADNRNITGGARHRFRKEAKDGAAILGILPKLGIDVRFSIPGQPTGKMIERAHQEIAGYSEKDLRLAGHYTGKSPSHKPSNYNDKDGAPLAVFLAVVQEAFDHYNTRADRRGSVAFGKSYAELFNEGLKALAPSRLSAAQRDYFFAVAEKRTVSRRGEIALGKRPHVNFYFHTKLLDHIGKQVVVRFDPEDYGKPIRVEDFEGNIIAANVPMTRKTGFDNRNQLRDHERAKNAEKRAIKEAAKQRNRMTVQEMQSVLGNAPPAPETPISTVVKGVFARPSVKKTTAPRATPIDPGVSAAIALMKQHKRGSFR